MYRDIIGEPIKIEVNGQSWWYQEFNGWDGNLKSVILYDADGEPVAEFPDFAELEEFVRKAVRA